jgi:NAD(P)H-hydrate epimerase
LVVDAIFGFSFKGSIREPYFSLIKDLKTSGLPICSVDIPSGWNVDTGSNEDGFEQPSMLVSLSAPKKAASEFKGVHYLGGRFIPESIFEKYKCKPPIDYTGSNQFIRL